MDKNGTLIKPKVIISNEWPKISHFQHSKNILDGFSEEFLKFEQRFIPGKGPPPKKLKIPAYQRTRNPKTYTSKTNLTIMSIV